MSLTLGSSLSLHLTLQLVCGVCQVALDAPSPDGTFFIGNREYRVNVEQFLALIRRLEEEGKFDPLVYCPSCKRDVQWLHKDQNYRRRARRFIKKHLTVPAESMTTESPKS